MKQIKPASLLQRANHAFQMREFAKALELYQKAKLEAGPLVESLNYNISLCFNNLMQQGLVQTQSVNEHPVTDGAKRKLLENPVSDLQYEKLEYPASRLPLASKKCALVILAVDCNESFLNWIHNLANDFKLDVHVIHESNAHTDIARICDELTFASHDVLKLDAFSASVIIQQTSSAYDYICTILQPSSAHSTTKHLEISEFTQLQIEILLKNLPSVVSCFDSNPTLGYVGCAEAFRSSSLLSDEVKSTLIKTLADPNQINHVQKGFGYFSDACYWARTSCATKILPCISKQLQDVDSELSHISLELSLGALPALSDDNVALIYSCNQDNTKFSIVLKQHTKIAEGSRSSVGTYLHSYKNLNNDITKIKKLFSPAFYRKHYPFIAKLNMPLEYHYLRFGVHEGFNPNKDFSSLWNGTYGIQTILSTEGTYNPFVSYIENLDPKKTCFPAQENTPAIANLVSQTLIFDKDYYLLNNLDVAKSKFLPLNHYVKHGWIEGRLPCKSSMFDVLWYEYSYISQHAPIDPLLHYAVVGNTQKLSVRPQLKRFLPSTRFKKGQNIRRVCLFAGYDAHGQIDDYVIELITEISRHADVYYLADSVMHDDELKKLEHITLGAWAFRHGEYDFGSYARLALQLVGWERVQTYDEVLLVNDSGYLLTGLDNIFSKMAAKKCDWWGLQATKGIAATRNAPSNQFPEKIPMSHVLEKLVRKFEDDDCYDFLIGSYFLAFRKATLETNGVLHTLLSRVRKERNKRNIVLKYEVGLTRNLIANGHRPATFIDDLYPFHPIFTENHFKLIQEGFPLFKRYYLTENHYKSPNLWDWKSRIESVLPDVKLATAEKNLHRISNAEKLYRTLNIPSDGSVWPRVLLTEDEFRHEDIITPKDVYSWAFPVCAFDHSFGGNERMVFEKVKNDPSIKKVILYRSKMIEVDGVNLIQVPLKSREGQQYLLESVYIFIKHTPWRNAIYPLNPNLHRFINLWHGIPLKRIGFTSLDMAGKLEASAREHDKCHAVIASSKIDRLAMAASFYPLTYHDVWVTGLPRNDAILQEEVSLPVDFQKQLVKLRKTLNGRRLVMYAPTFRNGQELSTYSFSKEELDALSHCLVSNNAVLGIREHMAAKHESYWTALANTGVPVIDLGRQQFSDIELIYREADVLITDYSSCFIDFMLTGKPEICFAYDYESYATNERGLFYDLKEVFPGPVCSTATQVIASLEACLTGEAIEEEDSYFSKRNVFFEYIDYNNTQRVVQKINNEISENLPGRKRALDFSGTDY